jgi:hypothetical protein
MTLSMFASPSEPLVQYSLCTVAEPAFDQRAFGAGTGRERVGNTATDTAWAAEAFRDEDIAYAS